MESLHGTVVGGRIVVEGDLPDDGAKVTIVTEGDEPPFQLSLDEEEALDEADAGASGGEYVTVTQLLAEIQRARG